MGGVLAHLENTLSPAFSANGVPPDFGYSDEEMDMRSKIGTKGLLAAHILALILLIILLINAPRYIPGPAPYLPTRSSGYRGGETAVPVGSDTSEGETPAKERERDASLQDQAAAAPVHADPAPAKEEAVAAAAAPESLPGESPASSQPQEDEEKTGTAVIPEPLEETESLSETDSTGLDAQLSETTDAPGVIDALEADDGDGAAASDAADPLLEPAENGDPENGGTGETPASDADAPSAPDVEETGGRTPLPQPDERGYLVVAEQEANGTSPIVVGPFENANLEVLGDKVYWLGPHHDMSRELAAVPEIGSLIILAPLPNYRVHGFENVKTEVIPADPVDLSREAAERFLHLTSNPLRPVVVAVDSAARGAAFFKGAYLLANRNLSEDEMLEQIESELEDAGIARDEIVHRLKRLLD